MVSGVEHFFTDRGRRSIHRQLGLLRGGAVVMLASLWFLGLAFFHGPPFFDGVVESGDDVRVLLYLPSQ